MGLLLQDNPRLTVDVVTTKVIGANKQVVRDRVPDDLDRRIGAYQLLARGGRGRSDAAARTMRDGGDSGHDQGRGAGSSKGEHADPAAQMATPALDASVPRYSSTGLVVRPASGSHRKTPACIDSSH